MKRLAIITTHPVQYNAPMFRQLAKRNVLQVKVFYTWGATVMDIKFDPGFNRTVQWDLPLLEGYEYAFVENFSATPGSHHFKGIDNPSLVQEIKDWKADAILIYGWNFNSHLKAMCSFKGKIPVLFRGDSTLLDDKNGLKSILRKIALRWIYRHIDKALYAGTTNKNYFRAAGLSEKQLVFMPHAIDNNRFNYTEEGRHAFRRQLGITSEDIVYLFAGKLEPKKNVALLLKAFHSLNSEGMQLVIAGNGVQEEELKKQYKDNTQIHFIDFQNQSKMPSLYSACDVFVLPSQGPGETWGLSVNEAMACGRAILVSDKCGCAADIVKEGKNGFVFKSGDAVDMINKIKILADMELFKKMGEQSKDIIQHWSFTNAAKAIEQTLNG